VQTIGGLDLVTQSHCNINLPQAFTCGL